MDVNDTRIRMSIQIDCASFNAIQNEPSALLRVGRAVNKVNSLPSLDYKGSTRIFK